MLREDYLMRLVKQVADFVKRVINTREVEGDNERARDEIQRGYEDLLGLPPGLSDRLDAATMATMLRDPDKMRAAAQLSWQEGHTYKAMRDPLAAFTRYRRAHELYLEARALDPQEQDDAAILELSRLANARDLDPRYRGET